MSVLELIEEISRELKHNFEKRARLIPHSGEKGEGREAGLRQILKTYLPGRFGVDTGFVVDSDWEESLQIDIIIYDENYTPVFEIVQGKRFFPCESVVAVGEVKSAINSEELEDSFDKIKSVKRLDRFGNPSIVGSGKHIGKLDRQEFRDQIIGFIFTGDSMTAENLSESYMEQLESRERYLWPNIYCDFNNLNIGYYDSENRILTANPMEADGIYANENTDILFETFHAKLTHCINNVSIASPDLYEYYDMKELTPTGGIEFPEGFQPVE